MHHLPTSTSSSSPSLTVKIVTFDVDIILPLRQYRLKLKKMQHVKKNVNISNRFKRKSISNKAFKHLIKKMYKMFPDTVC
jgi:hypothetical protein